MNLDNVDDDRLVDARQDALKSQLDRDILSRSKCGHLSVEEATATSIPTINNS